MKYLSIALACVATCGIWVEATWAQEPTSNVFKRDVSERTKQEAARPYRWIVEAAKKPRPVSPEAANDPVERKSASIPKRPAERPLRAALPASSPSGGELRPVSAGEAEAVAAAPLVDAKDLPGVAPPPESISARLPEAHEAATSLAPPPVDEPLSTVDPTLSPELLESLLGSEITVTVRLDISPSGEVTGASALRASHPAVRRPVLEAVRLWRYPAAPHARRLEFQLRMAV